MESRWIAVLAVACLVTANAAAQQIINVQAKSTPAESTNTDEPEGSEISPQYEPVVVQYAPPAKPKKPAPSPYKGVFYDNDFSYLDKPGAVKDDYYELLKRLHVTPQVVLDIGGEYRNQFKHEDRRSLFVGVPTTPRTDNYDLSRLRLYADATYGGWLRGYVEFIDAYSAYEDLPPLSIDEDRTDLLNAFGEVLLLSKASGRELKLRVGRQELLYGEQRLVSPLEWGNTRRTFEGIKLISSTDLWTHEIFWTRPVVVDDVRFNRADQSQWFGGFHSTYKGFENLTIRPYLFVLREEDGPGLGPNTPRGTTVFSGTAGDDSRVFTSGVQFGGGIDNWLWDVEGAYQYGAYGSRDISAGMLASGIGRKMPNMPWKPTVWVWYDWASGDNNPFDNEVNTFNQLFPLAHKWFGYLDLVARQNIHAFSTQFILKPTDKLTLLAWGHLFWLDEATDGLYNAAGVVSRRDLTGSSGTDVGQEIDLTATYEIRSGVSCEVGYSYFWTGDFIQNTGDGKAAHFLYTEFRVKF